jgi:hypothetical protein
MKMLFSLVSNAPQHERFPAAFEAGVTLLAARHVRFQDVRGRHHRMMAWDVLRR